MRGRGYEWALGRRFSMDAWWFLERESALILRVVAFEGCTELYSRGSMGSGYAMQGRVGGKT